MDQGEWLNLGFVIARGVFSAEEAAAMAREVERLLERTDLARQDNLRCRWANHVETGECRLDAWDPVIDLSPLLASVARDERLLALVASLYGALGTRWRARRPLRAAAGPTACPTASCRGYPPRMGPSMTCCSRARSTPR